MPYYVQVLNEYEKKCSEEARYVEAEVAKKTKAEVKGLVLKVEKAKAFNAHLKEKIDVE